jgi:uncharacterized protein (TIRG00374 family)
MSSPSNRRLWSWLVAAALAAILLYFALRGVDWRRVWEIIAGARWQWLAAGVACGCTSFFLRSLRWRILLNAEAQLSIGTVFGATMAGYLGNMFLPARAGELVRTVVVSKRSALSKTYVLTTALGERLSDAIALVLWSSVILLGVSPKPQWMEDVSRTTTVVAAVGALVIAILPHTGNLCHTLVQHMPMPAGLRTRLSPLVDQILLGLRAFHNIGRFLGFVALTAIVWSVDGCSVIVTARSLGLHVSFTVAMLLISGMGLSSALPSTPGYVGIFQFVAVTVLVPFGVTKDAALALILLIQAMGYIVAVTLGLPAIYRLQGSTSMRRMWQNARAGSA